TTAAGSVTRCTWRWSAACWLSPPEANPGDEGGWLLQAAPMAIRTRRLLLAPGQMTAWTLKKVIGVLGFQATRKLAFIALMVSSGAALAEPQPITSLPLLAQGENSAFLPAGEYSGQFFIDQPLALR